MEHRVGRKGFWTVLAPCWMQIVWILMTQLDSNGTTGHNGLQNGHREQADRWGQEKWVDGSAEGGGMGVVVVEGQDRIQEESF